MIYNSVSCNHTKQTYLCLLHSSLLFVFRAVMLHLLLERTWSTLRFWRINTPLKQEKGIQYVLLFQPPITDSETPSSTLQIAKPIIEHDTDAISFTSPLPKTCSLDTNYKFLTPSVCDIARLRPCGRK